MTNKGKIEHFDGVKAELDKLHLAVFDLTCKTKFPFVDRVTVNGAKEIDETFRCVMRVSVSRRAMPVYMVEFMDIDNDPREVFHVQFWTESMTIRRTAGPMGRWFGFAGRIGQLFFAFNAGWYFASVGYPNLGCIYLGKWDIWIYSARFGVDWSIGGAA